MKILGLDTATLSAGVALVDGDDAGAAIVVETRHDASRRTNDLLVTIDRVCREAGLGPTDLDAIAIGAGPGSFTGLRIGMATAKGIAFAAGRPLWAVSSLAALAHDATTATPATPLDPRAVIVAVLDARRGEVFAGCYRQAPGVAIASITDERVFAPTELAAWAHAHADSAPIWFVGDAIEVYGEVLGELADRWGTPRSPSGAAVARLALVSARVDVCTGGAPTYIRPSEAEVRYPDGVPGALPRR